MKKLNKEKIKIKLLTLFIVSCLNFPINSYSSPRDSVIYLDNGDVVNMLVDEPLLTLAVSYPGLGEDAFCSIDITILQYSYSIPIQNFINELSITNIFDGRDQAVEILSNNIIRISLRLHTFVDGVIIQTRDNNLTLKELIEQTLGEHRRVLITAGACQ